MRLARADRVRALAVLFAASTVALPGCGSSRSPLAPSAASDLRVMTFNIHHGRNLAGNYDLRYAIDTIARLRPDIVGVQELMRNNPEYNCDDQPAKIAQGLTRATGRQWTPLYHAEFTRDVRTCMNAGQGDGPQEEGIGFFAPGSVSELAVLPLPAQRLGLMGAPASAPEAAVVVTHLAPYDSGRADRMSELAALMPWSERQGGGARLLIGDFNSNPQSAEYQQARAVYSDAWADAKAAGMATGRMDGITHNADRIDFIFYRASSMELMSAETVDLVALTGSETSDHRPVVATFRVR